MSDIKQYRFSIILPNYNGGKYLEGCIKSVLMQNYDNYELIIIDGKSTDNSHDILKQYTSIFKNVIWLQETDKGISNAFNLGLQVATGDFISYLGGDDYLYDGILNKLNVYINLILSFKITNINKANFFCDSLNIFESNGMLNKRTCTITEINESNLVKYGTLMGLQNIYFNSIWIKNNGLDENNKYSMDYEVYFRMLKDNQIFQYFPEINSIDCMGSNISTRLAYIQTNEAIKSAFSHINKYNLSYCYHLLKRYYHNFIYNK